MDARYRLCCLIAGSLIVQTGISPAQADIASASALVRPRAAPKQTNSLAQASPAQETAPAAPESAARRALLNALTDPQRAIRTPAATTLASSSDEAALSIIEKGIDSGLYTETEAANYFGLADIKVGGPFLLRRLASGSPEAKALAVQYLGASPAYRAAIRDKVFFDSAANPLPRAAAATVLSQHDPAFATYALIVTLDPNIAAPVFVNTVRGYIAQMMQGHRLDAPARFLLRDIILNYEKKLRDDESLRILDETLKLMEF
jgi:hypothetical protein